ncbi:MAG TPA: zf-HC2 domain-containing protein [Vicinamibacterales bacterium]|jgi:hypothetical protein
MEHQEAVRTLASERYLLGEMTEAERDSFEEHYFSCAECADDVLAGEKMRTGAASGLIAAKAPQKRPFQASVVLPWAAAASLAVVAGYQSMRGPSSVASGPMALTPLTLRAATRGEQLTISPQPGSVVTLAIDLDGNRFENKLKYELRDERGDLVNGGEAPVPVSGAPLLLLFPSSVFRSAGRYVLGVQQPGTDVNVAEYRFAVSPH